MPGYPGVVVLIPSGSLLMVLSHDCLAIYVQHVHLAHFGDVGMVSELPQMYCSIFKEPYLLHVLTEDHYWSKF